MKNLRLFLPIGLAVIAVFSSLQAAPFRQAEITYIVNNVTIIQPGSGERPAAVKDIVGGDLGVRTGQRSRAELVFPDRTLTRLGANTTFNFEEGTRNLDLQEGVTLLQVRKNAGGATVRSAAFTAAITGTTIGIKVAPAKRRFWPFQSDLHGSITILVLEGKLKLILKNGKIIVIKSGEMVSMPDNALQDGRPVDFDVEKFWKSSKLLYDKCSVQYEEIEKVIDKQAPSKAAGTLVEAHL